VHEKVRSHAWQLADAFVVRRTETTCSAEIWATSANLVQEKSSCIIISWGQVESNEEKLLLVATTFLAASPDALSSSSDEL